MATPAPKKKLLEGEFATRFVSQRDACPGCMGVTVLAVETHAGIAGEVYSEFPWTIDPENHPAGPHYQVLWGSRDTTGNVIEEPTLGTPTCYIASRLAKGYRPPTPA